MKAKSKYSAKPITIFHKPYHMKLLLDIGEAQRQFLEKPETFEDFNRRYQTTQIVSKTSDMFVLRCRYARGECYFIGTIEEADDGVILNGYTSIGISALALLGVGIPLFAVFTWAFIDTRIPMALLLALLFLGLTIALTIFSINRQREIIETAVTQIFSDNYVSITK